LENGSSREGINFSQIGDLIIAKPRDLSEQSAIAAYLDRETAKLDALVAKVRAARSRLDEYRTALISAAVTGKIDVRDVSSDHEGGIP
jgi:type I restriction enzyme S subunit